MKTRLFALRETQLIHKNFSLKPTSIISRLFGSIYTLTIILTIALSSCGVDLDDDDGVKAVAAGHSHTVALKADGTLWAWGSNYYGQLGDGTGGDLSNANNKNIPVRVKGENGTDYLEGVIAVAAGERHTVAVKADGTVWTWGNNVDGQLGDGTITPRNTPVQSLESGGSAFLGVIAVAAGQRHTVAIDKDGKLWAWGNNSGGQLGDGTSGSANNRSTPVKVLESGGSAFTGVIAIAAGNAYTVALKADGTVWTWGNNDNGQLGNGTSIGWALSPWQTSLDSVIAVAAGGAHTMALKNDGTLWAWGSNSYGQLGDGTSGSANNRSTPVQVLLKKGAGGNPDVPFTDVTSVSGGEYHTIVSKRDGTLWAWGYNDYGQLGLGVGAATSVSTPQRLGQATDLVKVSAGHEHSTALRRSGILWTWGRNNLGQLGDGTNDKRPIPGLVKWD